MVLDSSFIPPFLPSDPSAVFDIRVLNVTTTGMELTWQSTDNGSEYTYHLLIQSEHGSDEKNSSRREIILEDLVPGTLYNITIFPEVNHIRGTPNSTAQYTCKSLRTLWQGLFFLTLLDGRLGGEGGVKQALID